ncbi:MAG: hypothetical protein DRN04_13070 [Thermoprotei archaeon]|nr:MAG: hypothetical protein DRN04_13070 [Thermoprotei archaeon]
MRRKGLGLQLFLQEAPKFEGRKQLILWRVFGVNIEKEIRRQEELMRQVLEKKRQSDDFEN